MCFIRTDYSMNCYSAFWKKSVLEFLMLNGSIRADPSEPVPRGCQFQLWPLTWAGRVFITALLNFAAVSAVSELSGRLPRNPTCRISSKR